MKIERCRINYLENPFIDRAPRLMWTPVSSKRGDRQSAYRVRVYREDEQLPVADTGWVESAQCSDIPLPLAMAPLTAYRYTVDALDGAGCPAETGTGSFTSGLCGQRSSAKWITGHFCTDKTKANGAVYLRKQTRLSAPCRRALLVICGLGLFEAHINGRQVGDEFLSTPITAYDQQAQYRMFDVTDMLRTGENAIGVILGNGFYNCFSKDSWNTDCAVWRDVPKLLCELHTWDNEGRHQVLCSGADWLTSEGPIRLNGIRHGEYYDARMNLGAWAEPGYDDGAWLPARSCRAPGGMLSVMEVEPIRAYRKYHPIRKWKSKDGWIFDGGLSQAGIARITFHGHRGDEITVRYCDRLDADNELELQALSMFVHGYPFQTDRYTKGSDQPETWRPTFSYYGFRYLEIIGSAREPELDDVEIWSLCNDIQPRGEFSCSDECLNTIQTMVGNSMRSICFDTIASDTAREKLSWTGDTGLSCEQFLMNAQPEALLSKWMRDLRDAQRPSGMLPCIIPTTGWGFTFANGPDWSQPIYEIPYQFYMQCGDTRELREGYDSLCRYADFLDTMAVDGVVSYGLGDWCAPFDGPALSVNMESFKCPMPLSDTAYAYATVKTAALFAKLLNKKEDHQRYAQQAQTLRDGFRRRFFNEATGAVAGNCQTGYGIMISFGLAEPYEVPALTRRLVDLIEQNDGKLDFGILGMPAVLKALGEAGSGQLAIDMLTRPDYPSIGHWIAQGATTLWECWNGGGSRNHHMFSSVSAFLYQFVAGLSAAAPGYSRIRFMPMLNAQLHHAEASVQTVRGKAAIDWSRTDTGFHVRVTVPVSCAGNIVLPQTWRGADILPHLTESGVPVGSSDVWQLQQHAGRVTIAVPSGTYDFAYAAPQEDHS